MDQEHWDKLYRADPNAIYLWHYHKNCNKEMYEYNPVYRKYIDDCDVDMFHSLNDAAKVLLANPEYDLKVAENG